MADRLLPRPSSISEEPIGFHLVDYYTQGDLNQFGPLNVPGLEDESHQISSYTGVPFQDPFPDSAGWNDPVRLLIPLSLS